MLPPMLAPRFFYADISANLSGFARNVFLFASPESGLELRKNFSRDIDAFRAFGRK